MQGYEVRLRGFADGQVKKCLACVDITNTFGVTGVTFPEADEDGYIDLTETTMDFMVRHAYNVAKAHDWDELHLDEVRQRSCSLFPVLAC